MKQRLIAIWALAAVFCPLAAGAQARGNEPQNTLRPLEGRAPQNVEELYTDFDPRREPLETQMVREWRKDGIQYRYVVYTVGTFRGRKARMAAFCGENRVCLALKDFKDTKSPHRALPNWSEITELTFRSASKSAPWEQPASSFRNLRWEGGRYGPTSKPFLPAGGDDAVNWQETGAAP